MTPDSDPRQLHRIDGPGFRQKAVFGPTPDEVLADLYEMFADWLGDMKALAARERENVGTLLNESLRRARERGLARDGSDATAARLMAEQYAGPDLLLFFCHRCPHSRDDFLRGEIPPYPWKALAINSPPDTKARTPATKRRTRRKELAGEGKPAPPGSSAQSGQPVQNIYNYGTMATATTGVAVVQQSSQSLHTRDPEVAKQLTWWHRNKDSLLVKIIGGLVVLGIVAVLSVTWAFLKQPVLPTPQEPTTATSRP